MKRDFSDILSRQQVDRIVPRVPWLQRLCVWFGLAALAWTLLAIFFGGIVFWTEILSGIR